MNKLARSITKWTKACDKRLNRLSSYIHHTCEYKQYCYVGNTAKQCRLWLFQDSDFAGDLEDSKSTSGGTMCLFGSHTFVPISWMCKKQTWVSHSATEAEIISLLMKDCEWIEFLRLVFGIWYLKYYIQIQIGNKSSSQNGATRLLIKHQRTNSATHRILLNYRKLNLFPQTRSVHMKERSCRVARSMPR